MADVVKDQAKDVLKCMSIASETIREAIAKALPVAPDQLLTVQVPGSVINPEDYLWDQSKEAFKPLHVRINEAKLVDGMIAVSKIMMGKTGRSVTRSYLAALDLLIPVEASISGTISTENEQALDPQRRIIRDRYNKAMTFLSSVDKDTHKSKLSTYVEKQSAWSSEMERYTTAQAQQAKIAREQHQLISDQRQAYNEWLQAHARDYKAAIQARYMDWVVHGFKFSVEFNFGIVDISSGMKRVENSKEAFRNLVLIADDGSSEYSGVNLTPSDWATEVKNKITAWATRNKGPSQIELKAELRRLENLLISHTALIKNLDVAEFGVLVNEGGSTTDKEGELEKAYQAAYTAVDKKNKKLIDGGNEEDGSDAAFTALRAKQGEWSANNLAANKKAVRKADTETKTEMKSYLGLQVERIKKEIEEVKHQLEGLSKTPGKLAKAEILDAEGNVVDDIDLEANREIIRPPTDATPPSKWTRVTCKVSSKSSVSEKESGSSSSGGAARYGWWFGGGGSHSSSYQNAMSSMANCDVEISMDCMLVEIERPWLHGELFFDSELDVGEQFALSPGPEKLKETVEGGKAISAKYTQFPSYPTAFVLASDVELSFSGDTTALESTLQSSTTEANVKVGWGPFSVSANHKQSKTTSKSKCESTATGMRIELQAPQIIGWVSTLLPELPRNKSKESAMFGVQV